MNRIRTVIVALAGVCVFCGVTRADLNDGLVGYWNCDEGEGTELHDASPNGYQGELLNGTGWTEGVCGSALDFDGVDDYVELPDIELLPDPFTICAWVDVGDNTLRGGHFIMARSQGNVPGEYDFAFRGHQPGEGTPDETFLLYLEVIRETGTFWKAYEQLWTNYSVPEGWHFYCASWDGVPRCSDFGQGIKLYIDAELLTEVSGGGSCMLYPRRGTHLTAIGAYEGRPPNDYPQNFAIDPIDEVRAYNRLLTSQEITLLYEEGLRCACPAEPSPASQGYWHRQCLGIPESEGGIDPGRHGRGPAGPTEPGFNPDLMDCADRRLEDLGLYGTTTCEGMNAVPADDDCERADKQLTALILNVCSERLADPCEVDVAPEGCTSATVGDLLEEVAALILDGPCWQAAECAAAVNEGTGLVGGPGAGGTTGIAAPSGAESPSPPGRVKPRPRDRRDRRIRR